MRSPFEKYRNSYRDAVNRSIAFTGKDVDFFAMLKADDLLEVVSRRLGDPAALRAVDVGCGAGVTDMHLVEGIGDLYGTDVSEGLLDAAAAANPHVQYRLSDGVTLPFDDGAFDVSFAMCVLHHVEPDMRAPLVLEMRRVTRAGGLVVVYEHNPVNALTRLAVSRCEFDQGVLLLGRGETTRLLRRAGAPPVEARYIALFPWQGRVLRMVERGLSRLPLGGQYVVVGQVVEPATAGASRSPASA